MKKTSLKLKTVLTCPNCKKKQTVNMPMNACQHFYKCIHCRVVLKPKEGDCCVFCSYSDTKCPPIQLETNQ